MTILDGLIIIQKSMKNKYYKQQLSDIFREIESGEFTLEEAFNKRKITPQVFNSMLKVAENTGSWEIFSKNFQNFTTVKWNMQSNHSSVY